MKMTTIYTKVASEGSTVKTDTKMTTIHLTVPSEASIVETDTEITTISSPVLSEGGGGGIVQTYTKRTIFIQQSL